jgi:hypothetical protein
LGEVLYLVNMKRAKVFAAVLILFSMSGGVSFAANDPGSSCSKAGAKVKSGKTVLTCSLVWVAQVGSTSTRLATPSPSQSVSKKVPAANVTVSQSNAARRAQSYLSMSGFSRSGLISQLEYEGFSEADATFGADAQKANWNLQAARKAKSYLSMSGFSREGLIGQLEYEGFSNSEASYGASANGL